MTGSEDLAVALSRQGIQADPSTGVSPRIGELYVMLTWRCNLRCRMCPMWGARGFCREPWRPDERLALESLVSWIDGSSSLRPRTVTLSGGEPMLSPLWSPLARELADRGHRVALTTNATLLSSLDRQDLAALHQINVSLDGPAFVLDALGRGGSETLDAVVVGLRSVLARRGEAGPRLRLLAVVSADGVGQLAGMLERLDREGVGFDDLLLQHTLFLDRETAEAQARALGALAPVDVPIWDSLVAPGGQVDTRALDEEIHRLRGRPETLHVSPALVGDDLVAYYASGRWIPPDLDGSCLSPWLDLGITPAGDVWLCPGHRVGNLFREDIEGVWNGATARAIRRRIAVDGIFPGCRGCFYLANYRAGS